MALTGIACLALATILLWLITFDLQESERPFEEISTLFIIGVTFLWFGTPRGAATVAELDLAGRGPHPPAPMDYPTPAVSKADERPQRNPSGPDV